MTDEPRRSVSAVSFRQKSGVGYRPPLQGFFKLLPEGCRCRGLESRKAKLTSWPRASRSVTISHHDPGRI